MKLPPRFSELINRLGSQDLSYLSGSIAEGTGHAHSDVDLYVIAGLTDDSLEADGLNTSTTYHEAPVPILIEHFEGQRWDLEYWSQAAADAVITKLESDFISGRKSISHGDAEFLCRVVNGQPLTNPSGHEQLRERVLRAGLRQVLMRRFAYSAEVRLEDAAGLFKSGSTREAALQIRDAFGFVVDFELARNHDFSLSAKRRLLRLERNESAVFTAEDYWQAECIQADEDLGGWCRKTTLRLRKVLANVE